MKAFDKLKLITMKSVYFSEKDNKSKIKDLEFIKEKADPYQCIGYILDGKFYNLNESGKKELMKRLLKEKDGYHKDRKTFFAHMQGPTGAVIGGVIGAAKHGASYGAASAATSLASWAGYRLVRSAFDVCTKKCGTFKINTEKRQLCLFKCKALRLEKEIAGLKQIKGKPSEILKKTEQLKRVKNTIMKYQNYFKKNK